MANIQNNLIDLDLSEIRKKRIRIDGDDNKIIEINISDMGVMERLKIAYDKLDSLAGLYHTKEAEEQTDEEALEEVIPFLKDLDTKMRELVDYIFNAPISAVCVQDGTMADPVNGRFKFDYIIEKFLTLYDKNFDYEFKQLSNKVKKHTGKYTKKG